MIAEDFSILLKNQRKNSASKTKKNAGQKPTL
jgi:hypothetical protein